MTNPIVLEMIIKQWKGDKLNELTIFQVSKMHQSGLIFPTNDGQVNIEVEKC